MEYDAYLNIKKKYTKSAIEKILIMMDYKKREEVFYCGNDDEYKLFTGVYVWLCEENEQERIYRVRAPIFAMGYDLQKMNETLRSLKLYCDASFESDYGRNRYFPENNFNAMYEITPNTIPSDIEYANGIIMIVKNAGTASV